MNKDLKIIIRKENIQLGLKATVNDKILTFKKVNHLYFIMESDDQPFTC